MFTIDSHLDLATNAINYNRDLRLPVMTIRQKERDMQLNDTQDRGNGTVAFPELRSGEVGLVVATIISRFAEKGNPIPSLNLPGWHSPEQAYAGGQAQLAWYKVMEDFGEMVQITNKSKLQKHLDLWNDKTIPDSTKPIGYILSLEGADSIINLSYLEKYYENGLRAIGLSHFGPGRYAAGTQSDGSGINDAGKSLLQEMDKLNMILDLTHLTDKGFFEAVNIYKGTVWASHQNCRSIINGERQFSDDQIKVIIERGGVIGGALDAWMLYPDFKLFPDHNIATDSPQALGINLEKLVEHFDHICQLAGNSLHIGFGSDLDGLYGTEQSPCDLDTIADLQKFNLILSKRGYTKEDIENIFHGNWLRLIRNTWKD